MEKEIPNEFIDFAKQFSSNAWSLSPGRYSSGCNTYNIDLTSDGNLPAAEIRSSDGLIRITKSKFYNPNSPNNMNKDYLLFLLIWLYILHYHVPDKNVFVIDRLSYTYAFRLNIDLKQLLIGMILDIKQHPHSENIQRTKDAISEITKQFNAGKNEKNTGKSRIEE